jgi:hypothetical protein
MVKIRRFAAVGLLQLALLAQPAVAGSSGTQFTIRITVLPAGEHCTTSTSAGPHGLVLLKVVCPSGTFVTADGVPVLAGPMAYKFRYYIDRASGDLSTLLPPEADSDAPPSVAPERQQVASVTSFEEVSNSTTHNLHELLISF